MIAINNDILNKLTEEAKQSVRLRMNLDLRDCENDTSQRMLNAIEPDSVVPIHRHPETTETIVLLRGSLEEIFYDISNGCCKETQRYTLSHGSGLLGLQIPIGQWHNLRALESGTIILEVKNGTFHPIEEKDIWEI